MYDTGDMRVHVEETNTYIFLSEVVLHTTAT